MPYVVFLCVFFEESTLLLDFAFGGAADEVVASFPMGVRAVALSDSGRRAGPLSDSVFCGSFNGGDDNDDDTTAGSLVFECESSFLDLDPDAAFLVLDPEADFLLDPDSNFLVDSTADFLDFDTEDVFFVDSAEALFLLDFEVDFLVDTAAGFLVDTSSSSSGLGREGGFFGGGAALSSSSLAGGSPWFLFISYDRDRKVLFWWDESGAFGR